MAPRANWKGFLKIAELSCPVALYTAVSSSDRMAFHILNRSTGHRVQRQFVDEKTGDPVETPDQVKGYQTGQGEYVILQPEEIAAAVPESDKTLGVEAFIPCSEIDDVYFDRSYYLAPSDAAARETFALIRQGMHDRKVAALARTVLFRRVRTLLIRPHDDGMIATTLDFDYEVRSAADAFADVEQLKIAGEMLDLAKHIIATKRGTFDPSAFHDRYEQALAELVRAKQEGRKIQAPKLPQSTKVVDLMEALRRSAGGGAGAAKPGAPPAKRSKSRRPAAAVETPQRRRKAS
jgi:DNA end-binding protein Ku